MRPLDRLSQLILSALYRHEEPISRYEVMQAVNQMASFLDRPYSPGAIYHCIQKLSDSEMIKFNQNCVEASALGRERLREQFIRGQLPGSVLGIIYQLLCLSLCADAQLLSHGRQKMQVEMIKFNQSMRESLSKSSDMSTVASALTSCQKEIGIAISKVVLDLGGDK